MNNIRRVSFAVKGLYNEQETRDSEKFKNYVILLLDNLVKEGYICKFGSETGSFQHELRRLTHIELCKVEFEKLLSCLPAYFAFVNNNDKTNVFVYDRKEVDGNIIPFIDIMDLQSFRCMFLNSKLYIQLDVSTYTINLYNLLDTYYRKSLCNYQGVIEDPDYKGKELVNIWIPPPYKIKSKTKGNPNPLFFSYIRHILAAGGDKSYNHLINLFGNIAIFPYKRTKVCPIFSGPKDIISVFIRNFVECVFGQKYIIADNYNQLTGLNNTRLYRKNFVICEFNDNLDSLEELITNDEIIINFKSPLEINMCLNFCMITEVRDFRGSKPEVYPIFVIADNHKSMNDMIEVISDKEEMSKFVNWLQSYNIVPVNNMSLDHVVFEESSLELEQIINLIDMDILGFTTSRNIHQIEFKEVYEQYLIVCEEYNLIPMEKSVFYTELKSYYRKSNNREFIYVDTGNYNNKLIRRST